MFRQQLASLKRKTWHARESRSVVSLLVRNDAVSRAATMGARKPSGHKRIGLFDIVANFSFFMVWLPFRSDPDAMYMHHRHFIVADASIAYAFLGQYAIADCSVSFAGKVAGMAFQGLHGSGVTLEPCLTVETDARVLAARVRELSVRGGRFDRGRPPCEAARCGGMTDFAAHNRFRGLGRRNGRGRSWRVGCGEAPRSLGARAAGAVVARAGPERCNSLPQTVADSRTRGLRRRRQRAASLPLALRGYRE